MKLPENWRQSTLQILEDNIWGKPDDKQTALINNCLTLRKKPLDLFTIEDLRMMIGQQIGLPYLIPLALEELTKNALAEGDLYPGDLFERVLNVHPDFWLTNPDLFIQFKKLVKSSKQKLKQHGIVPNFKGS